MSQHVTHIVCPHCDVVNRIPAEKPAKEAKCGRCHRALFDGQPAEVTGERLEKHIRSNEIPVVVDFWAPWCGPCRMMAPAYERAAGQLEPNARLLKLNTENDPGAAERYGIRSIPTLIMFRNGQIVDRVSGAMDERRLQQWIVSHAH
ncbi:thioredoxin TrxC [Pseudorhodoplanes sp.]|uniref:thioredoxin TrxC n=1 Tax=Pseudorhodoplanes sp. TaxID=1934341 RepID=UPI00391D9E7A